jgi:hypothetical protein
VDTTAKFYLERMCTQVESARRRHYPDAAGVPAIWLSYIDRRLRNAEGRLTKLARPLTDERKLKLEASALQTELVSCYDDLEVLRNADSSQVAHFLVRALKRWFDCADHDCDYLFTSGINFEILALYEKKPEEVPLFVDPAEVTGIPPRDIFQIVMPGGALGSAFHVPLVAHEAGHILHDRYNKQQNSENREAGLTRIESALSGLFEMVENIPSPEPDISSHEVLRNWMEEVFADTICGFIAGPAGFFALHEKLRLDSNPDKSYPHNDIRIFSLKSYIEENFDQIFLKMGITLDSWRDWPVLTEEELLANVSIYHRYSDLSRYFISILPQIRGFAVCIGRECMSKFEYKSCNLDLDLDTHLEDFLQAIPPYETRGDLRYRQPTDLVSILNVGWFIAAFRLQSLNIRVDDGPLISGQLLVRLDQLILKAIELSEIRRDWIGTL